MTSEIKLTIDLDQDDPHYALSVTHSSGLWTLTVGSVNEQTWFTGIPQSVRTLVREVQDAERGAAI